MKRNILPILIVFAGIIPLCSHTEAVIINPTNIVKPSAPGQILSFDLGISSLAGFDAMALLSTVVVDGDGLTFDSIASKAVADNPSYWIFGNSAGIITIEPAADTYQFSDGPDFPVAETAMQDDLVARFAFIWDGTQTLYTFTLTSEEDTNYFLLADASTKEQLLFATGDSFTIDMVPEPSTLIILLGGSLLAKRRSRRQ